jgi:hypothetical protein
MPKALCIFGMVIAGLLILVFGLDLATGVPFDKASMVMDVGFAVVSALLGFVSWTTFREQA